MNAEGPNEIMSQIPVDVSYVNSDNDPIIKATHIPATIGSIFFEIFIYLSTYFKLYTLNEL